jgi:preprotein translocase subunit SecF
MLQIIPKRKIWLTISGLLTGASIIALVFWGLNFGIDFTGGSLLEVKFKVSRPDIEAVKSVLADMDLGSLIVQPIGESDMILRFQNIDEKKHQAVLARLDNLVSEQAATSSEEVSTSTEAIAATTTPIVLTGLEELRFDSVGPTIGQELKSRSLMAIIIVLLAIVLYIAWAFRKVSKPVASWKYGVAANIALFHDVLITLGVFSVLGHFYGVEINSPFVAAILTVLGYSVNDTIVVFDRIRENLPKSDEDFEGTVNTSVNQTITRSINTSLTTLLVLLAILFFGGVTIRSFVLALSIGVFIGTYSSIFLASPILVVWEKMKKE